MFLGFTLWVIVWDLVDLRLGYGSNPCLLSSQDPYPSSLESESALSWPCCPCSTYTWTFD